jgi:hypothetical protein
MTDGSALAAPGALLESALDEMVAAVRTGRSSIEIATPFLSAPVARLLAREARSARAKTRRLLTAVNVGAVEGGYLDPDALIAFRDADFEVASVRNLHAKVVLVDRRWGLVGSGNLTVAGSNGGNAELGVVLNASQSRRAAMEFFDRWWDAAEMVNFRTLPRLARRYRPRSPERRQREGQGGFYKSTVGSALAEARKDARHSGYWLKIMYSSPQREEAQFWRSLSWVGDRHQHQGKAITHKPSYAIGDQLVIYLTRGARNGCPAIVRVKALPRYDPSLVRKHALRPDDHKKWSWVTEVEVVASVRTMAKAPSLSAIGVASRSVRQQGHIHISDDQFREALRLMRGR